MEASIEKDANKFFKTIENYVKHKNLEIELTLITGEKILLDKNRSMKGNLLIQHLEAQQDRFIQMTEITKADIYAV